MCVCIHMCALLAVAGQAAACVCIHVYECLCTCTREPLALLLVGRIDRWCIKSSCSVLAVRLKSACACIHVYECFCWSGSVVECL